MIELVSNPDPGARIKVIGAGGCGGNAVNHMINRWGSATSISSP